MKVSELNNFNFSVIQIKLLKCLVFERFIEIDQLNIFQFKENETILLCNVYII